MAVEPITAVAEAVKEIAATIRLLFNGENRKILADVKRVKNMKKAIDSAERALLEADLCVPKENKDYWKQRDKFIKYN